MSRKLKGIAAAPGIAIAPLVHFHSTLDYIPTWKVAPEGLERERRRFGAAIAEVGRSLQALRQELSEALSLRDVRIYDAQVGILNDPTFQADVLREIELHGVNVEVALQRAIARYETVFENMQDGAMRERAADLRDIGRQLVGALMAYERSKYTANGCDYLFAADEFLPSDAGILDRAHLRGIVTAHGGKYSHGSILARSLGIPAVVGVEDVLVKAQSGTTAIVDGDSGTVIVDPSAEELAQYQLRLREQNSVELRFADVRRLPAVTLDGVKVALMANVEGVRDLAALERDTVAGIGLFRTEFAFMERRQFPTEDEQVAMYQRAMEEAAGLPVTFRTLDVGGDKPLGYFRTPEERNPVLGWRGLRICLDWPDILFTQLRAVLRASALGKARILLPMVTTKGEVVRCREVLAQLLQDLRTASVPHDPDIELGIMVEVPVMVTALPDVLPLCDFISVGTNDLVQYLLAVDRDNQRVAKMYDPFHPGVLRVLQLIGATAQKAGKPASVCGEIAGDHWFTPLLLGFGFRELSMAPTFLPRVKLMVRSFTLGECRSLAQQAVALDSAAAVRKLVQEQIRLRLSRFLGQAPGGAGA
ncbi:MAG TPA: phosphoenolpyruvate--protein phosphotransferase [Planctomycetota bacterium]|nr:phosphoenolpyruvate--protein phosphotransferase [Planctomycetota bacterium]